MLPVLSALVAIQQLDTTAEGVRKRLAEVPAAEQVIARKVADHTAALDASKAALAANQQQRRELEKKVAAVDARLAKFSDHRAAVKTNQEYTALLHEIEVATREKSGLEDEILALLEAADALTAQMKEAAELLDAVRQEADAKRAELAGARQSLESELSTLKAEKASRSTDIDAPLLAKYERLLDQRKMVAVAAMVGELCTACHVRLRPAVAQIVRRNSEIVYCDSCQRILYAPAVPAAPADAVQA